MSGRPVLNDWEIPQVSALYSSEERTYSEFQIPGRSGSLFQDMNKQPVMIVIAGSLFGEEGRNTFLTTIREKFHTGEPVTFTSDILTATELQYVIIETLKFQENGESANETEFMLVLRESPPPPPPPDPLGGLDTGLLDQAAGALDSVTGALDVLDALGNIPDIGNPTEPLSDAAENLSTALSGFGDTLIPLQDIFGSDN